MVPAAIVALIGRAKIFFRICPSSPSHRGLLSHQLGSPLAIGGSRKVSICLTFLCCDSGKWQERKEYRYGCSVKQPCLPQMLFQTTYIIIHIQVLRVMIANDSRIIPVSQDLTASDDRPEPDLSFMTPFCSFLRGFPEWLLHVRSCVPNRDSGIPMHDVTSSSARDEGCGPRCKG